jgi:hypothetical protein
MTTQGNELLEEHTVGKGHVSRCYKIALTSTGPFQSFGEYNSTIGQG